MTDISKAAGLSQLYTNHSCRATTVHLLDEAQIPSRHIMSVTGHKSETSLRTYSGKTCDKTKKLMSETISEKTLCQAMVSKPSTNTENLPSNIDFLCLSQSSVTIETESPAHDFDLQPLSNSQTETLLNDLIPNDSTDEILKTLEVPKHPVANQGPLAVDVNSMRQCPLPVMNNCNNITVNYNFYMKN